MVLANNKEGCFSITSYKIPKVRRNDALQGAVTGRGLGAVFLIGTLLPLFGT
jgi:hypothetical protein